jgi:uncharacterized protein YggU (UPF0235/DUF167 family)
MADSAAEQRPWPAPPPPSSIVFAVRVKPGSRAPGVGGRWGDPPQLVVAVRARAVEGAANAAVVAALALAFGVPSSSVAIVRGQRGRSKLCRITGPGPALGARLASLLSA